jgi:hypothetical protein
MGGAFLYVDVMKFIIISLADRSIIDLLARESGKKNEKLEFC